MWTPVDKVVGNKRTLWCGSMTLSSRLTASRLHLSQHPSPNHVSASMCLTVVHHGISTESFQKVYIEYQKRTSADTVFDEKRVKAPLCRCGSLATRLVRKCHPPSPLRTDQENSTASVRFCHTCFCAQYWGLEIVNDIPQTGRLSDF